MQSGASAADSPCSSRASVAGSSCSEPWSGVGSSQQEDELGQGTSGVAVAGGSGGCGMVLRKRVRKMGRDVKKFGDQVVEVRGDLKTCRAKIDNHTKQARNSCTHDISLIRTLPTILNH